MKEKKYKLKLTAWEIKELRLSLWQTVFAMGAGTGEEHEKLQKLFDYLKHMELKNILGDKK